MKDCEYCGGLGVFLVNTKDGRKIAAHCGTCAHAEIDARLRAEQTANVKTNEKTG